MHLLRIGEHLTVRNWWEYGLLSLPWGHTDDKFISKIYQKKNKEIEIATLL